MVLVAFLTDLVTVLLVWGIGFFILVLSFPAITSLILEQAPDSRGTMMSMNMIFQTGGMALGTALGGLALILSDWTGLILTFAALQLTAATIFFFLAKDHAEPNHKHLIHFDARTYSLMTVVLFIQICNFNFCKALFTKSIELIRFLTIDFFSTGFTVAPFLFHVRNLHFLSARYHFSNGKHILGTCTLKLLSSY